jgi:hypothetical protein
VPWGSEFIARQIVRGDHLLSFTPVFQTLTTSYASEVSPVALRA